MTDAPKDWTTWESEGDKRSYSWPPFEKGHTLSVRHGASSERLVSERAAGVLADLIESYPWLQEADAIVLDVLVRAKVRFNALDEYISGVIDGTVEPYPAKDRPTSGVEAVPQRVWEQVSRESRTVIEAAGKLGLTATDRAQLFKDTGMARHFGGERLADLIEKGRQIRLAKGDQ